MQMKFYFDNIWNYEHEMKWTRLWCKIIFQTNVKQTKGNGGFYFCLHSFGDLTQKVFMEAFICPLSKQLSWKPFKNISELQVNYKWTITSTSSQLQINYILKLQVSNGWISSIMDEKWMFVQGIHSWWC
jgi:hypothetical protein